MLIDLFSFNQLIFMYGLFTRNFKMCLFQPIQFHISMIYSKFVLRGNLGWFSSQPINFLITFLKRDNKICINDFRPGL